MERRAQGRARQGGAEPSDADAREGKAGERQREGRGNAVKYGEMREVRLSSGNVPEGARGAICIKRSQPTESRLAVIWATYAFMHSEAG